MPWQVKRDGSALHVPDHTPVTEWPGIFESVRRNLVQPHSYVLHIPPRIEGGSEYDAEQLRVLRDTVGTFGSWSFLALALVWRDLVRVATLRDAVDRSPLR